MNLRNVRTFVAIADAGGIARAGNRLNLSQPAASRQILALEACLGVKLFERIGRRFRLTSEGEYLLTRSRRLLVDADSLSVEAEALRMGNRSTAYRCFAGDNRVHSRAVPAGLPASSSGGRDRLCGGRWFARGRPSRTW